MAHAPFDYEANKEKLVSSTGQRLTVGLFEELKPEGTAAAPIFKLSDWKQVYVDIADPTGYQAAIVLIGDWDHWQLLMENKTFAAHVEKWNLEVEAKLRSEGVKRMMAHAKGPAGTAAAKWLAEGGFVERDKRTKKGKKEEEQVQREVRSKVSDDAKRLGLSLVKS